MRIFPVSDLHLDHYSSHGLAARVKMLRESIEETHPDVLVVAGDTVSKHASLAEAAQALASLPVPVLMVLGNHDHWHYSGDVQRELEGLQKTHRNFFLLQEKVAEIDGVVFAGTTLWFLTPTPKHWRDTNWVDWDWGMLTPKMTNDMALVAEEFLMEVAAKADVIVTHHLPLEQSIDPRYARHSTNQYFLHNMRGLIDSEGFHPKLWIHGHTHSTLDYNYGKLRVVCNPAGYDSARIAPENPDFNPKLIVEI